MSLNHSPYSHCPSSRLYTFPTLPRIFSREHSLTSYSPLSYFSTLQRARPFLSLPRPLLTLAFASKNEKSRKERERRKRSRNDQSWTDGHTSLRYGLSCSPTSLSLSLLFLSIHPNPASLRRLSISSVIICAFAGVPRHANKGRLA